ncbi:MAG: hypothetical protein AB7R55_12600 [Gemmatimonadales bacterium]
MSPSIRLMLVVACSLPSVAMAQGWPGRDRFEPEACSAAEPSPSAREWLERARRATGLGTADGVLHWRSTEVDVQFFQSDRPAPPYIESSAAREWWFDPATGVERWQSIPAGGPVFLRSDRASFVARDTALTPSPPLHRFLAASRALNPLAVLFDWTDGDARVAERCELRGYPRVVLERGGERLYLDPKSGIPVKLERIEPHPTWGQVRAEYLYGTWWRSGAVILPVVSVRYVDGVEHLRRNVSLPQRAADQLVETLARADAPPLAVPDADHRDAPDFQRQPTPVDTIRVDANTVLLSTRLYTHAVTLQRDTVFLFDATTGEWRSRADSALIATLFPGARAMVLVVTDLAWPHIDGVRFWVARGATIVAHELAKPFLTQLVERRWTLAPDLLARQPRPLRVRTTRSGLDLAGGAVRVRPIDGTASEGALMVAVPSASFLWAGDYIQTVDTPSQYAIEVVRAVEREGLAPTRTAAQHLPLTPWPAVVQANPAR